MIQMYQSFFIQAILVASKFWQIMNKAAKNMCLQIFEWINVFN